MGRKSGWSVPRFELKVGMDTPFALFLRRERKMRNESIRSLSAAMRVYAPELKSIDGSYLSRWEHSHGLPSEDQLEVLASFFGIPLPIFVGLMPTLRYIELDVDDLASLLELQKERIQKMSMADLSEAVMRRREYQHEAFWSEYWNKKYQEWVKSTR